MKRQPILKFMKHLKALDRPVFTTREAAGLSGKSISAATQALNFLEREGFVFRAHRGVWAQIEKNNISPYTLVPYLFPRHRAYVSFISALHLYGIIEQIPQVVTLASTAHTRTVRTKLGVFSVHTIAPDFFRGFDWYKGTGAFLIAEPEKALVDSLYLSGRRKKQFGFFPELNFSKSFSFKRTGYWAGKIPDSRIRSFVKEKLRILVGKGSISCSRALSEQKEHSIDAGVEQSH